MASLKKTIAFATPEGKAIIDNALSLEAQCSGWTIAGLLETHLLNSILPRNEPYTTFARLLLLNQLDIRDVVVKWAAFLAAGISPNPKTPKDFETLIHFCLYYSSTDITFPDKDSISYFRSQADSVLSLFDAYKDSADYGYMKSEINCLTHRLSDLDHTPIFDSKYLFEFLSVFADQVKNFDRTYRLISFVARLCTWADTDRARYALLNNLRTAGAVMPEHS